MYTPIILKYFFFLIPYYLLRVPEYKKQRLKKEISVTILNANQIPGDSNKPSKNFLDQRGPCYKKLFLTNFLYHWVLYILLRLLNSITISRHKKFQHNDIIKFWKRLYKMSEVFQSPGHGI